MKKERRFLQWEFFEINWNDISVALSPTFLLCYHVFQKKNIDQSMKESIFLKPNHGWNFISIFLKMDKIVVPLSWRKFNIAIKGISIKLHRNETIVSWIWENEKYY